MSCLSNPFSVPMTRVAMLIHCDNLGCSGYAIEIFFDVITEYRTYVMRELLAVLQEHNVVEGDVIYEYPFAIGSDIWWKSICHFQALGHLAADPPC